MDISTTHLNFVSIENLLYYVEAMVNASHVKESKPPSMPRSTIYRIKKVKSAKKHILKFVSNI